MNRHFSKKPITKLIYTCSEEKGMGKKIRSEASSLYICTTPFQIISSISLAMMREEPADICIDPQFNNAERYIRNIKNENLFIQVFNAEQSKSLRILRKLVGIKRKAYLAIKLLYGKQLYCEILQGEKKYETIYTSSNNEITRYLMNYVLKKKWNTEIVFFDDGEGSYDDNCVKGFNRIGRSLLNRLLVKEITGVGCKHYLYAPEYYNKLHPRNKELLLQLPKWNNSAMQTLFARIFELNNLDNIQEQFILLDVLNSEVFNEEDSLRYEEIVEKLANTIGTDNFCIKKHPRDKKKRSGIKEYQGSTVPFECLITTFENHKILISLSSTAVMTPKLLFDREYNIILLYRLFNINIGDANLRELLFHNLQEDYTDKDKVFIPNNEGELFLCIENLVNGQY